MLSVNLPQITLSDIKSNFRIAHLHANLPGVLARVNRVLGEDGINIAAQALGTEGEIGYVVTDVAQRPKLDPWVLVAGLHGSGLHTLAGRFLLDPAGVDDDVQIVLGNGDGLEED